MFFARKRIYLDCASATPLCEAARCAMRDAEALFGNPSSIHGDGAAARRALEAARETIAAGLGCKGREIVFTSGITEANNLAILGRARDLEMKGRMLSQTHWLASSLEHASILDVLGDIERRGGRVTYADPDARGIVAREQIGRALRKETVFVSVGLGNNEIGTIQPLSAIGKEIRAHEKKHGTRVLFHTDAGQAPLYLPSHVHSLGVDALSLGAAKIYGPHGIAALFVGNRAELAPIILGGGQERGLRSGTESVALAAGFAAALADCISIRGEEARRLAELRDELARGLLLAIPGAVVNGDLRKVLPHMLNISVPHMNSEYFVLALDRAGLCVSTKSACSEGESRSHVVEALVRAEGGNDDWRAESTVRFSLGRGTTARDIKRTLRIINTLVGRT